MAIITLSLLEVDSGFFKPPKKQIFAFMSPLRNREARYSD